MTQEQSEPRAKAQRGTKSYLVLATVILAILVAAGALSYYGDEIRLFLSQGGWNRGEATRVTRQFIDHLQAGRRKEAVALVSPDHYTTYSEGGKEIGLEHQSASGRGRYFLPFETLVPPGTVTLGQVEMTAADGGGFVVPVSFADGTKGWFVVARAGEAYRIVSLPTVPGRFHY
jgi:hypothetical protein